MDKSLDSCRFLNLGYAISSRFSEARTKAIRRLSVKLTEENRKHIKLENHAYLKYIHSRKRLG